MSINRDMYNSRNVGMFCELARKLLAFLILGFIVVGLVVLLSAFIDCKAACHEFWYMYNQLTVR